MIRASRFAVAAFFTVAIIWTQTPIAPGVSPTRSHLDITISPSTVFLYRAYLDKRSEKPRLRVFAINKCVNDSILHVLLPRKMMALEPVPIEGSCPWHWADGCKLSAYIHEVHVPDKFTANEVKIEGPNGAVLLPLHTIEHAEEQGLTVCVPPIYWYTDWTKLILFVEWWRRQQTSQFIFYYQSSTKDVKRVLDYYVSQGWAQIVPWPKLPSSSSFEPNDEVYRLAHSLAHNDCLLRTKTEFMALVDIDELIQPMNSSLMEYVNSHFMDNSSLGAILFPHRVALYNPPLAPSPFRFEDVDFTGIGNVVIKDIHGPMKAVVRTNVVNTISTHGVHDFRERIWKQEQAGGAYLLHNRYNYVGVNLTKGSTKISIVGNPSAFQAYLFDKKEAIFPTGAYFKEETQRKLGKCLASWRSSQGNCKAPTTACRETLLNDELWVEDESKTFTVV